MLTVFDLASEYYACLRRVMLVSDIPPCTNYSGGIFLDHILKSLNYRISSSFIVLNQELNPAVSVEAAKRMAIDIYPKPVEYYARSASPPTTRESERNADRHIHSVLLPKLLSFAERRNANIFWVLLEGQSMIRLTYYLMARARLPIIAQVMDPPLNWFRVHNVDKESSDELLEKYDHIMRNARVCAAASWAMAVQYRKRYSIPCFPVVPSLPLQVAHKLEKRDGVQPTFKIALAGQIYAQEEWRILCAALQELKSRSKNMAIEVHAFTKDRAQHDGHSEFPIYLRPWLETEDLLLALQDMDLLYCPYRFGEVFREESELCFPSKLTTYLAAGRPVLFHGPEYSSPAQFLRGREAAFTCLSLDADDLASVIERAISDRSEYEKICSNGARAFAECLSYEFLSRSMLNALSCAA